MDLRQLRYFAAVAEERHFGRAARRQNITQPALTRQIQNLETNLRVRLLDRDRKHVELTHAGAVFLAKAKAILASVDDAVAETGRAQSGEVGRIEIGHAPAADLLLLSLVIPAFRARYPDVTLSLHSLSGPDLHQALTREQIQVALLRLPIEDPEVATIPLVREQLVAVLPERHRLAEQETVSITDLADEPIILFPRHLGPRYFDQIATFCSGSGGFSLRPSQESETIQTTLALVASGLGVSIQPQSIRTMLRTGVVYRDLREPSPEVICGIAYQASSKAPIVRNFVELAVKVAGT